jgi:hypothetical protein
MTGVTRSAIMLNENTFLGLGAYWPGGEIVYPLFMKFSSTGSELDSELIDPTFVSGSFDQALLHDSVLICMGLFGTADEVVQTAEAFIDTAIFNPSLQIYNHILHPGTRDPFTLAETFDHKILSNSAYVVTSYNWDIYLAKLNMQLESDSIYLTNFTYDSLCQGGIQSGTIYMDDCEIITNIGELPSPKEYYALLATIPIKVYPNPARDMVNIALTNTEYNTDILLQCFDFTGRKVLEAKVHKGQKEIIADVSGWSPGLYIAVVTSEGKVAGKERVVVMR